MGNLGKIGKLQKSKKHKKLKPVDPFNRGGRQAAAAKAAKGTDKTPKASQIDDQDMTRSMRDFIRSKKMMAEHLKNPQKREKKKNQKINDYQENDDRRGMTRPVRPVPEFHKKKGERDGHFVHRASMAAAAVVGESRFEDKYKLNANPTQDELDEKKQKKEEWKKKKAERREKRKKKRAGGSVEEEVLALHKKNKAEEQKKLQAATDAAASSSASLDDQKQQQQQQHQQQQQQQKKKQRQLTDFGDLRDKVAFGEVALAPPSLTVKPRKAEVKDVRTNLLLSSVLAGGKSKNNKNKNNNNNTPKKAGQLGAKKAQKLKKLSALQKSSLMHERDRVVEKYRKLKAGNLAKL